MSNTRTDQWSDILTSVKYYVPEHVARFQKRWCEPRLGEGVWFGMLKKSKKSSVPHCTENAVAAIEVAAR